MTKKITIANFYPVWPPVGGGQRRIFFLARELAKKYLVDIVVLGRDGTNRTIEFGENLREITIAAEQRFRDCEHVVDAKVKMAADLAYTLHWNECQSYQRYLRKSISDSAAVVSAHPYSTYAVLDARGNRTVPFVFDSQNVEYFQKTPVLADQPAYLEEIGKIERTSLEFAALSIACSQNDAEGFAKLYNVDASKIRIVENGVDAIGVPQLDSAKRAVIRAELGLENKTVALFAGSFHFPNFKAADRVLEMAKRLPGTIFVFLGSVCKYDALANCGLSNVILLDAVDESTKWLAFHVSDIGLNPMETGSGTNIKLFEYAAAELHILTTKFGARGTPFVDGKDFTVCEIDEFASQIGRISALSRAAQTKIGKNARNCALKHVDWSVIGSVYRKAFDDLLA
ncbi:MAG: glycosyltransferase [Rhizobiaceae bacterium]